MKPIQALFFDLDGTLLDGSRFKESIVDTCGKIAAFQPGLEAVRLVEVNSEVWQGYWSEVEDKWTLGALDGVAVTHEAWRRTLRACGCKDEAIARLALQIHWQLGRQSYRLFDDVRELFTSVIRAHVPLALITNGASDTQRDKLRALGIEHWFDAVIISGEVGIAKPDAAAFGLALDDLAVEGAHVWHVGDNLTTDVAGAKAAGITAAWLNRSGDSRRVSDPEPDVEIHSLSTLLPMLEG